MALPAIPTLSKTVEIFNKYNLFQYAPSKR